MHILLFGRISSSNSWNIISSKDVLIRSTTWVDVLGIQDTLWSNLLYSPYLCNFLFWLGIHGFSLFRDLSHVTITSHMFNFMEIEAFYFVHRWGCMTSSFKVASRRLKGTIIFVLVVCLTSLCHIPKVCTRIEITKKYTLVLGGWRLPWCTSKVIMSWNPLIKFITSCILDIIYISSWSRVSSNVILTLLIVFAGTGGINISYNLLHIIVVWSIRVCIISIWGFTCINRTWFIKRIPLMN